MFSNGIYPQFVLLPLQIRSQGQAEHDTTLERYNGGTLRSYAYKDKP